jgi:hypothetical protein
MSGQVDGYVLPGASGYDIRLSQETVSGHDFKLGCAIVRVRARLQFCAPRLCQGTTSDSVARLCRGTTSDSVAQ